MTISRRRFIQGTASSGAALGLGLPPVASRDARVDPALLRPGSGIEPLVALIADTARDKVIEEVAVRIRSGLPYRDLVAALMLAAIRNVQPRPNPGFKFHAVLVIWACHQASQAGPDGDRWLPLLWAVDQFKVSQAEEKKKSGWQMGAIDESKLPPPHKARQALVDALENWDDPAAEEAAAALARSAGAHEAFDLLARYGARDFRALGHKAIFMANGWRTLESIGWSHAEPILRSLAQAYTSREGAQNPARGDAPPDRPWKRNLELSRQLKAEWRDGRIDPGATTDLLAALRQASDEEASKKVLEIVNGGISPQSVWDALFLASGELLMRRANIPSIHAVTTMNALRYAFDTVASDETRRLIFLQAAAFLPLFRGNDPKLPDVKLDQLEPVKPGEGIPEILADISRDKMQAARKVLGSSVDAQPLIDAARVVLFQKGMDVHDYKFASAALEDYGHVSPAWRARYLASSVFWFRGSGDKDNGLVERIRGALKG